MNHHNCTRSRLGTIASISLLTTIGAALTATRHCADYKADFSELNNLYAAGNEHNPGAKYVETNVNNKYIDDSDISGTASTIDQVDGDSSPGASQMMAGSTTTDDLADKTGVSDDVGAGNNQQIAGVGMESDAKLAIQAV